MKITSKNGELEVKTYVNIGITLTENGTKFDVESELQTDREIMKEALSLIDRALHKAIKEETRNRSKC